MKTKNNKPRILLLDVETSPLEGWAWQVRDTNLIEVKEKSYLLSASWQWHRDSKIDGFNVPYKNDKKLCQVMSKLIGEADLLVYQNGEAFDLPTIRTRILDHRLPPLPPTQSVDTLRSFRRYFKFPSNKLDDVCKYLGIAGKLQHEGFPMWKGCMNNESKWQAKMLKYNKHDVKITGEIYEVIKPHLQSHPHIGRLLGKGAESCPVCGSLKLKSEGVRVANKLPYRRLQCLDCGNRHKGKV